MKIPFFLRLTALFLAGGLWAAAQTYSTSLLAGAVGSGGATDGVGAAARFDEPGAVGADGAGNLYVIDFNNTNGLQLRKISPAGAVTTLSSQIGYSRSLAVGTTGAIYLADEYGHVIRRVAPDGVITVVAGQLGSSGSSNGSGTAARFNGPRGLAVDASGTLYVCDTNNYLVRKITAGGTVSTVAGLAGVSGATDGPAPLARFSSPADIAVDGTGTLFVLDRDSYRVRKIAPSGEVTTLAGNSGYYGSVDGTGTSAQFGMMNSLCLDATGTLFVTESANNTVRRVSAAGVVTTILGFTGVSGAAEGVGKEARFFRPAGLAADAAGNLFIADSGNRTVRKAAFIPLPVVQSAPAAVTAVAGQSAGFSVVSAGGPTLSYQWQRQMAGGGAFVNVADGGPYSGANTASLLVSGLTAAMNTDQFRCVVTNVAGTAFSPAAALTVNAVPVFTSAAAVSFPVGAAGAFLVTAAGAPAATFTVTGGAFPAWASLQTSTGIIAGTPPSTAGSPFGFTLTATNAQGVATQNFTLTVPTPAVAPTVMNLTPSRQVVPQGGTRTFTVTATGAAPLSYQWKRNGLPIPGATAASYTLTNAAAADAGYYQAVVTNAGGSGTGQAIFVNLSYALTDVLTWGSTLAPPTGFTTVTAVAAGSYHGVVLRTDGTLQTWGSDSGLLAVPAGLTEVVAIAAGTTHSLALRADGTVVAWGYNNYGESSVPAGLTDVVAIAAGERHSVALKANGTVVEWGTGYYYAVTGHGVPAGLTEVVAIAAGDAVSSAVKSDGGVVSWGYGASSYIINTPARALPAQQVALGGNSVGLTVRRDGGVAAWGYSSSAAVSGVPADLAGVTAVACSAGQGAALRSDGSLVTWGEAFSGTGLIALPANLRSVVAVAMGPNYRLALRNAANDTAPVITSSPGSTVANLGQSVTFAATASAGTAPFTWQWYKDDVAITGATASTYTVTGVEPASAGAYRATVTNGRGSSSSTAATLSLSAAPVASVSTGGRYPLASGQSLTLTLAPAISATASVQWRHNGRAIAGATGRSYALVAATAAHGGYYQAIYDEGSGPVVSAAIFVPFLPSATQVLRYDGAGNEFVGFDGASNCIALSSRGAALLALFSSGKVGRSLAQPANYSYYGDEATYVPADLSNVVALSAGNGFYLALRADGTVTAWGSTASQTAASLPALGVPAGLTKVVAVSAGVSHALALRGDGTVVAWGASANGATAVPAALTNVVAVAAGDNFSLALRGDGTVVGWGRNENGESSPPTGLSGVSAIVAASSFSLALKYDGTVVAWGASNAAVPAGLSGVVSIAAGDVHALALRDDGTVAVWGGSSSYYGTSFVLPPTLRNVMAVAGGSNSSAVLRDASADTTPVIVSQPADAAALTGQTVVLRVAATGGTAPLSYQWSRAGSLLSGATQAALSLVSLTPAEAGSYQVKITNYLGFVYSRTVTLSVSSTPAVAVAPAARTVLPAGGALTLTGTSALSVPVSYQWRRNGRPIPGATAASYPITAARWSDGGAYQLVATNAVGSATSFPVYVAVPGPYVVRAWGDNSSGQIMVPAGLTEVVSVAAGYAHSLALKADGSVVSWGTTGYGLQNLPVGLGNVVAVAAGYNFSLALRADGTVTSWGALNYVPADLTGVVAIAAGANSGYALALRLDGTMMVWSSTGVRTDTPANLGEVVGIAQGGSGSYAMRSDGSVVRWLSSDYASTPAMPVTVFAAGAIGVAAGPDYFLVLNSDGSVTRSPGSSNYAYSLVIPPGLSGVATVMAGSAVAYALKTDGTVVALTSAPGYEAQVASVSPALLLAAGNNHTLVLRDPRGDVAPLITAQSAAITATAGQSVTFSVTVSAVPAATYQWYRNGSVLGGATAATLTLTNISNSYEAGTYTVTVSNAVGSVSSSDMVLTVTPTVGQRGILRATARANALPALLMSSFVLEGTAVKALLVRGVGPALAGFGLADTLGDPRIDLTTGAGSSYAANENWGGSYSLASTAVSLGAFPLPAASRDAALLQNFSPGTYHVRLTGTGGGGVALLELYDADSTSTQRLVYVSTHAYAGSGNDVFVEGLQLSAVPAGRSYLIRALGPTLTGPGALADPRLAIFSVDGNQVAGNDDWAGDATLAALVTSAGAMPLANESKDAALKFVPNAGGVYTIKVTGASGTVGRVLLEIFELDAQRAGTTAAAIVAPPVGLTVVAGQPAAFGVVTIGKPAPTYQWRKNGTPIAGATEATYTLPSVQAGDAADYTVVATNPGGAAVSSSATLVLVSQSGTQAVVGSGYVAGGTATITNTLSWVGTASGLGWKVTLPPGWTYAAGAGAEGDVRPAVGTSGTLEWAWTSPPTSPLTFAYTVNVPAGETGVKTLAATAILRAGASPLTTEAVPGALPIDVAPDSHTADTNQDRRISLLELTRVIELYNTRNGTVRTGAYSVATTTTEDGFSPEPTRSNTAATLARRHSADTNNDGRLSLLELTRVIELYNTRSGATRTGSYHVQGGSEDGFAPGL